MDDLLRRRRALRKTRDLADAQARVLHADRSLSAVLHPSIAAGLTPEARASVEEARRQVRAVSKSLQTVGDVHDLRPRRGLAAVVPLRVRPT